MSNPRVSIAWRPAHWKDILYDLRSGGELNSQIAHRDMTARKELAERVNKLTKLNLPNYCTCFLVWDLGGEKGNNAVIVTHVPGSRNPNDVWDALLDPMRAERLKYYVIDKERIREMTYSEVREEIPTFDLQRGRGIPHSSGRKGSAVAGLEALGVALGAKSEEADHNTIQAPQVPRKGGSPQATK